MSDLISRQATLKHIEKIIQEAQMLDDTHRADILMRGMYLCERAVKNQSPAIPEIIRCKDCKYWNSDALCCSRENHYIVNAEVNDYCSYGELKDV